MSINNTTEIIPAAFISKKEDIKWIEDHDFYKNTEYYNHEMATAHYYGRKLPLTEFSSWAASLHLAICYAKNMLIKNCSGVYVAIMDTKDLERDVKVWHVPHLLNKPEAMHEYLAHGCIRGRGYKAVPYELIEKAKLEEVFPEVPKDLGDQFGIKLRGLMFAASQPISSISSRELNIIGTITNLFDNLSLPVAAALINIRPRPDPAQKELEMIIKSLEDPDIPLIWAYETWLDVGMVNTIEFPDVKQWIDLLRALSHYKG